MKAKLFFIAVLLACTLTGCAGMEPYAHDFEPDANENPGMFSGEKGEFEILKK